MRSAESLRRVKRRLLSRPLTGAAGKENARIELVLEQLAQAQPSTEMYTVTGTRVRKILEDDLGLKLSEQDRELFLAAGARGAAAIYTEHLALIHLIRKVLLRTASYAKYAGASG